MNTNHSESTQVSTKSRQYRALGVCALLAALGIIWVMRPIGFGLLMGMLIAFSVQPIYERLRNRFPHRGPLTLAGMLLATTVTLSVFLAGVTLCVVKIASQILEFANTLPNKKSAWVVLLKTQLTRLHSHYDPTKVVDAAADQIKKLLTDVAGMVPGVVQGVVQVAGDVMTMLFDGFLAVFFLLLSLHFFLRYGDSLIARAELLLPLQPRHTRDLLEEFRRIGRGVLLGTVISGVAQGILAGFGYLLVGLPNPVLFGALTAFGSLIPVVGTALIWIPIGIYLMLTGHVAGGIVLLCYGTLIVVGVVDYIIRPVLVGRESRSPSLFTFIGLLGGVAAFNVKGLILGPVIMSICVAVLRLYEKREEKASS